MGIDKCSCTKLAALAGGVLIATSASVAQNTQVAEDFNLDKSLVKNVTNLTKATGVATAPIFDLSGGPGILDGGGPEPAPNRGACGTLPCSDSEGEALCADVNDGCNQTPPAYGAQLAVPPASLCGSVSRDPNARDTDWYTFSLSSTLDVSLTITGEFDVHVILIQFADGTTNCGVNFGNLNVLQGVFFDTDPSCNTGTVSQTLSPGQYAWFIAPRPTTVDGSPIACGTQYEATFTATAPSTGACCLVGPAPQGGICLNNVTEPDCLVSGLVGGVFQGAGSDCGMVTCPNVVCDVDKLDECSTGVAEPDCGQPSDICNIGCNGDPLFIFKDLTFDLASCPGSVEICGTSFAGQGTRDTDWFLWSNLDTVPVEVSWSVTAEFPLVIFFLTPNDGSGTGIDCDVDLTGFVGTAAAGEKAELTGIVEAGDTVGFFVAPGNADGTGLFEGVPCGSEYNAVLSCDAPSIGACCIEQPDMTKICVPDLTEAECKAQCGIWQGADSLCADAICCEMICREGALSESDLVCGGVPDTAFVDANGGCNNDIPVFDAVNCGDVICGTAAFCEGIRDLDWFEITVTQKTFISTVSVAQFNHIVFLVEPGDSGIANCDNNTTLSADESDACFTNFVGACVEPGTYWIIVAPEFDDAADENPTGEFPCCANAEYEIEIFCADCSCDKGGDACPVGSAPDTEPACDSNNEGCAGDPVGAFTAYAGGGQCGTITLTIDDMGTPDDPSDDVITRDIDYYEFVAAEDGDFVLNFNAEFVADVLLLEELGAQGECNTVINNGVLLLDPCTEVQIPVTLVQGTRYYIFVAASFDAAFGNCPTTFDCAAQQTYNFELKADGCPCLGDVNGDCSTDAADLSVVIGNFGMSVPPGTGGDLNGDGSVDAADLSVLIGDFGCSG